MILNFYYNYKDILKSPRIALGPQRVYIATIGFGLTHIIYFSFQYLALFISDIDIMPVWAKFGLLPYALLFSLNSVSYGIAVLGIFLTVFLILITNTALARSAYMYMRNNYYYTSKQSIRFALRKCKSILSVYLTFLFLILPFIAGAIFMSIIGRLSGFGEILNALATLPYIFAGMVLVFMVICLILSFFLAPAIIASSEEDGFGTAVQCMNLTWGEPWRLASYSLLTILLFIVGVIGFAFVIKIGLLIYSILFLPLMHSLSPIMNNALYFVEKSIGGLDLYIRELIGSSGSKIFYLKTNYVAINLPLMKMTASFIIYFFFMITGYMIVGYGQGIVNSALTMSYIIFEKKLTGKSLLERKDSELEEDKEAFEFNTQDNTKSLS